MSGFTREFRSLWQSVALSNFTDGGLRVLLPFIALSLAVSPSDAAYVFTFLTLAWPLFGFFAGALADRTRSDALPFWCHAIRALVFFGFAHLALADGLQLYHLYVGALIFGFFDVLFEVSMPRLIRSLTEEKNRIRANTRLAVTHTIASEFLGSILGAALSLFSPFLGLLTVSVFYAISSLRLRYLLVMVRCEDAKPSAASAAGVSIVGLARQFGDAAVWLYSNPVLIRLSVIGFGMSLSWGAWLSLQPYYLIEQDPVSVTKLGYGVMMAVLALGAFVSALVFERIQLRRDNLLLLLADTFGVVILLAVSALTKSPILLGIALFLMGVGATVWASIVITLRQEMIPVPLMGRVNGMFRVITYGGLPIGSFVAGSFADHIPIPIVYAAFAAISLLFGTMLLRTAREHTKLAQESA